MTNLPNEVTEPVPSGKSANGQRNVPVLFALQSSKGGPRGGAVGASPLLSDSSRMDSQSQRPSTGDRSIARSDNDGTDTSPQNGHQDHNPGKSLMPQLVSRPSDFGPDPTTDDVQYFQDDGWTRHGFDSSDEHLKMLQEQWWMYYTDWRHETGGKPKDKSESYPLQEWRMRDRLKTISAALALCLNIGVDPPDVIRTSPSARMECWVDPLGTPPPKALETIGKNLQAQYESLSVRTRYKQYLDPSIEETKKNLMGMRRNAKDERVLFHYNGHGVPKPTASGEIWVFNKNYTQYIPISLYDIQSWLGSPSLLVFDCSDAGNIIKNFNKFVAKREDENREILRNNPNATVTGFTDSIQLAACGENETLPTNPDLPADLFTCCLTTPVEISLRFFVLQNPLPSQLTVDDVLKIPGRSTERRTPAGELNWIFTAITDTIAWNTLPRDLFKKLFRQDLMVAALFRNFLLSQRIMRVHKCKPESSPKLPETHNHPLWQSWDLAVEMVLAQLPAMRAAEEHKIHYEYQHSTFFAEQLTAFEVYLARGAVTKKPPDQLPIVLQVLLSQVHRLRALILLSKFLDLGPWAVNLALSIGIFPYVLKLLQSAASELKPVMVFIWARILAVDQSCQQDLLKDNGYQYFIQILNPTTGIPVGNYSEHRAMCAFIITMFCRGYHQAQRVCLQSGVIKSCLMHLTDEHPLLRQWACLCIGELWVNFPDAKWDGISVKAHELLLPAKHDFVPEVRAAMLHALSCFLGIPDITEQIAEIEGMLASAVLSMTNDGSNVVRKELLVFYSTFVKRYENKFMVAAYEQMLEEQDILTNPQRQEESEKYASRRSSSRGPVNGQGHLNISRSSVYASVWKQILVLSVDPYPDISDAAAIIVDNIIEAINASPLGPSARKTMDGILGQSKKLKVAKFKPAEPTSESKTPESPKPKSEPQEGLLKRTFSYATTLKNLAWTGTNGTEEGSPRKAEKPSLSRIGSFKGITPKSRTSTGSQLRGRTPSEWSNTGEAGNSHSSSRPSDSPLPRGYKRNESQGQQRLPLESTLVDWSIEYFRVPQMKQPEAEEPGSTDYNQRLWRRTRNERIMASTQPQKDHAGISRWDTSFGFFNNNSQPKKMVFHQFEDHLVVSDDMDGICVWDWYKHTRLNRFSNNNPVGTKITDLRLINEDDQALLMSGSSDGIVRIFRNYEVDRNIELVSAWRALNDIDMSGGRPQASLLFEWLQGRGKLLVAGDTRVIKVWSAYNELCISEIPARSGSAVTALSSEQAAGDIFVAGFSNGVVRVYDQRVPNQRETMVRAWKRYHDADIVNVHMQRGGQRELVSGSSKGDVIFWDIRMEKPLKVLDTTGGEVLRSLSVHEHDPVFAVGTSNHSLSVYNTAGSRLSTAQPFSSFLHQMNRAAPIVATAFHPHRMMLACSAANDAHVSLFTCDTSKRERPGWDS